VSYAIFDIETRIDKQLLADTLYRGEISAEEAYERHCAELREQYGSDFVSIPFHVPIAIAVASVGADHGLLSAEALPAESEQGLVRAFWQRAEGFRGCLVSFNGRGFDLPVLELQALRHGISMPKYFAAKYGARYRFQTDAHLDLQEFLTNNGAARMRGGLDVLLRLCGYAGKGDLRGGDVQRLYEEDRLPEIDAYCVRDVVSTYRLFLRVQVMRGMLDLPRAEELAAVSMDRFEGGNA
jgi:3'-5' exonuclease